MATIRKMSPAKRRGISTILLTIIVALIGVGLSSTIYVVFNEQIAGITSQTNVAVSGFSADLSGDRLSVSANIQNLGQSPITSVVVEEFRVGDFEFVQDFDLTTDNDPVGPTLPTGVTPRGQHGFVTMSGLEGTARCTFAATPVLFSAVHTCATPASTTVAAGSIQRLTGVSTGEHSSALNLQALEGGGASAFRLVIESGTGIDISDSIDVGDEATLVLRYLVGESQQVSSAFKARVK